MRAWTSSLARVAGSIGLGAALLAGPSGGALARDEFEQHWSPSENLERIDVDTIESAKVSINMAAYVLSDTAVIEALERRAAAGVKVRVLLDGPQLEQLMASVKHPHPLERLATRPNVEVRVSAERAAMHLKAYAVDANVVRTGSADFTASGLKQEVNELMIHRAGLGALAFEMPFQWRWLDPEIKEWKGGR